jgi:hypothetical protein
VVQDFDSLPKQVMRIYIGMLGECPMTVIECIDHR